MRWQVPRLPSGKLTVCELENGPVEIVDFPIENGHFPLFFVCLPEGIVPNPTSHAPDHIPGLSADLLVLVKIPKKIARYSDSSWGQCYSIKYLQVVFVPNIMCIYIYVYIYIYIQYSISYI